MQIKKKILLIILLAVTTLIAQTENKSQSIELPSFVITGIQSVSVPTMDKKKSEFVPIVGTNFLTPNYDSEEFSLVDNSNPIKKEMELKSAFEKYNGLLQLGAGLQTLPIGDLYFGFSKSNFLFNSHLYGSDTRDFVPYSGYNTSGAKVKLNYFVNHNAKAFPGLSISAVGNFRRDNYDFYGTSTPTNSRENQFYAGKILLSNQLNRKFQYGFNFSSTTLDIKLDETKENIISGDGFLEFQIGAVSIGGSGNYKVQKINDNVIGYNRMDYLGGKGYIKLANSKIFDLKIGAQYSQLDTNNLFSPMAILSIFVEEGVALFISYGGNSEFVTLNNFMSETRYFENSINNIFQKKNSDLRAVIKYDFSDIFEINAGFYSAEYDNYHYYEDLNNDSKFNIVLTDGVSEIGGFLNVIINAKKYGELFVNLEFQDITNADDYKIPYKPMLIGDISYGYMFNFGLYSKFKLNYSRFAYTNLANTQSVPDYVNLGVFLKYSLFNSLALTCDLQNLLNRKDYLLKGYQEKNLDVIVGVEYRW
ncbi:MAG: TonB-dependent receptor [Melioribacteraceae bacterium]|jgi:hypothetical protein|nr:TonB-dependent receptor [Melioribacteraceae bacterium]